mmetsp:Transcript_121516/g.190653  ORF Transcript_121516/g.190653 Transcript_121516/m.190653 type:complete len:92 (-) Transcript_121516:469-744(-)
MRSDTTHPLYDGCSNSAQWLGSSVLTVLMTSNHVEDSDASIEEPYNRLDDNEDRPNSRALAIGVLIYAAQLRQAINASEWENGKQRVQESQ